MAAEIEIDSALHLGFRFEPTPKQAVTYFLPRLITGEPMHASIRPFIHDANIYACAPGVLAAQFCPTPKTTERFFFTTCKRQPGNSGRAVRAAGPGSWHSQGHTTDVEDGAGVKIGEVKKFRYRKGGAFTDWLMDEFSCCSEETIGGDRQRVLCKMYVSPRAGPDSAARQESDAFVFAPPPTPEEPIAAPIKRPAPPIAEPPRPKRIRIAGALTAPVVKPQPFPPSRPATEQHAPRTPVQAPVPHSHLLHQPSVQAASTVEQPPACSPVAASDPFCRESPAAALHKDDGDFDLVKLIEGGLETEDDDTDDWFAPMMTTVCKGRDPFAAAMISREEGLMMPTSAC